MYNFNIWVFFRFCDNNKIRWWQSHDGMKHGNGLMIKSKKHNFTARIKRNGN